MKDTKINCFSEICYWNTGTKYKDNCARGEICISEDGRCQTFITKEEAERRLKIATAKFRKKASEEK